MEGGSWEYDEKSMISEGNADKTHDVISINQFYNNVKGRTNAGFEEDDKSCREYKFCSPVDEVHDYHMYARCGLLGSDPCEDQFDANSVPEADYFDVSSDGGSDSETAVHVDTEPSKGEEVILSRQLEPCNHDKKVMLTPPVDGDQMEQTPSGGSQLMSEGRTVRTSVQEQLLMKQLSIMWRSQLLAEKSTKRPKGYQKWKYERAKKWQKDKRAIKDFFSHFNIWANSFKSIEGSFGSSVASYFQFIKWLLVLNVFIFLTVLAVIILPQALVDPESFNDTLSSSGTTGMLTEYQEEALICSQNYVKYVEDNTEMNALSLVADVFKGTGFLMNTYIFIGYYFNKTQFYDPSQPSYDLPLAHLISTACYLMMTLILMIRYTATGVREGRLSKGDRFYKCFSMVFCGWDYNLSQRKAAAYKHINLAKEITGELSQMERAKKWALMSMQRKACIYIKRVVINIISIVCLVGCGFLIYYVVQIWKPMLLSMDAVTSSGILSFMVEYLPSVTLTVLNLIIPMIFQALVVLEEYSPSTELTISLLRMVFLRMASLVILAVTMFRLIRCDDKEVTCGSCHDNIKCWETYVGQELYKLVVLDFVLVIAMTIVEFIRKYFVTKFKKLKMFQQHFDLPTNVLKIVYTQTLCWWGSFFSPIIPAIIVVEMFILFYCKKVSLMKNQMPPSRPYCASKSNHFFMMILLLSFVMAVVALTYTAGWVSPSQGCSPFRVYITPDFKMVDSVTAAVKTLPTPVQSFFHIITSWLVYIIVLIILSLVIFFNRAKSAGSQRVTEILHNQFTLLEKDKRFLLNEVKQVLQH